MIATFSDHQFLREVGLAPGYAGQIPGVDDGSL